jgi:hypothetical protein
LLGDQHGLAARDLPLGRHVTEGPVVLAHAALERKEERAVAVMPRLVDLVDQRRALVRSAAVVAMAGGAVCLEVFLPRLRAPGQLGQGHADVGGH